MGIGSNEYIRKADTEATAKYSLSALWGPSMTETRKNMKPRKELAICS